LRAMPQRQVVTCDADGVEATTLALFERLLK
jgi:hypothetical protein